MMSPMNKPEFTVSDVEKLAALSRLALTTEEKESFAKEIGGILEYVGQIQEVSATSDAVSRTEKYHYTHRNIMREDKADKGTGVELNPDSDILIQSAPNHTDEYVKVKKILGGSE